ncbi:hypothetical protein ACN258_003582 [Vibrio cholerae]|uniref:hypothetical protein n=1 Tax=Vibrio cholerae TaxID=666 RepID=UPI0011DA213B|nr:hypothetical protein [Vibrio cholerae]EGR0420691.1 hypothetical protein [Vibrio cholerae]EGR4411222.1 hypothetical protein [Vibrio cholerae]EKF9103762.1 hypothetical protein [Vibrio cholerae]ELJ8498430.1 hypothetical protein [Vibrio cholerae]MCU4222009.1 hypothetical protein [Vibrio cholerae]
MKKYTGLPSIWVFAQILFIFMPLIIMLIVATAFGLEWDKVRLLPEWSFIAMILIYEIIRDADKMYALNIRAKTEIDSVKIISIVMLLIASTTAVLLLGYSFNKVDLDVNYLVNIQMVMTFLSGLLCMRLKYIIKVFKADSVEGRT